MLRRTLVWPTLLLAALVCGAFGYVGWDLAVQTRRVERRIAEVREETARALRLRQLTGDGQRLVLSYAFTRDERLLEAIDLRAAETEEAVDRIGAAAGNDRGARIWSHLATVLDAHARTEKGLVEALRGGKADEAARAFARWEIVAGTSRGLIDDFAAHGLRKLERTVSELQARRLRSLAILLAVLAASALTAVAYSAYVKREVVRPLQLMTQAADRLGSDEVVRVPGTERSDEIGVLARALEHTTGEIVAANARLAESVRARDDFLSIASHELKTPLTPLRLHLDMAARRLAEGGETPRWILVAQRQIGRLESLVDQLLDVTRIRGGRFALRRREVDLADVVAGAAERLGSEVARNGNDLRLELAEGAVGRWDAERLEQVVANLLSNAVKYAPGAPIQVSVEARPDAARLTVRDGGPGIPAAARARLFERFERGPEGPNVGGLGLGLYIVRKIVEAHGGRVWLEGGEGGGAAFVLELPREEPAPAERSARR